MSSPVPPVTEHPCDRKAPKRFSVTVVMKTGGAQRKRIGTQGGKRMHVTVEQLGSGKWEARVAVATPMGPRYFCESGLNRTAALLSLRQTLGLYRGDGYQEARAALLEQALA
jgi:hypothetical protein